MSGEDKVLDACRPGSLYQDPEGGDFPFWVVMDTPIANPGLPRYVQMIRIGAWSSDWFREDGLSRSMEYLGLWAPGKTSCLVLPAELLELLGVDLGA